jgi:hypothetical protein
MHISPSSRACFQHPPVQSFILGARSSDVVDFTPRSFPRSSYAYVDPVSSIGPAPFCSTLPLTFANVDAPEPKMRTTSRPY